MPECFSCHRPAAILDRQIGKWVCEGNEDCSMSRLARVLAEEHLCEHCRAPNAHIFDGRLLCDGCRQAMWKKYWKEVVVRAGNK